ncbi:MAG: PHP domain-containing protein [Bacteroidota bacterium]|nr:PHP domain-containing protein [Bacteroidota bacterium]
MKQYKADLHTHTVLSPCGDLEMSPLNIIKRAKEKEIDIIGITDHNSTKQCAVLKEVGADFGVFVLSGAEITTKEEVHCLTFFENEKYLSEFQKFIEIHMLDINNDVNKFGYQCVVDRNDNIIEQEEKLLITALDVGISEVEKKVHQLNGLFIPAHIDRLNNSLLANLGFLPLDLAVDALEISKNVSYSEFIEANNYLKEKTFVQDSDAHFIDDIAKVYSIFEIKKISFREIKMALRNEKGRKVKI